MSKVYVVQKQLSRNKRRGGSRPVFDFRPAEVYGELVFLLSDEAGPHDPVGALDALRDGLRSYCAEDYLLLVGNPCLIGWAALVCCERLRFGEVPCFLQWDGDNREYFEVDGNAE